MSKPKHTPGDWKVMPGTAAPRICVDGDKNWPIVVVSSGRSQAEIKANELLIAAAPEMLEALKVADRIELLRDELSSNRARVQSRQGTVESIEVSRKNCHELSDELSKIRRAIRAAIAKAKGRP